VHLVGYAERRRVYELLNQTAAKHSTTINQFESDNASKKMQ